MKKLLFLLLLIPMAAGAQSPARFDLPVLTTIPAQVPVGSLPHLLAVTNATVAVCGFPATMSNGMCTNTVSTYTDSTLTTACPAGAQLTAPGSSVCISTTGLQGSFGFWYNSATQTHMTYTVKTAWGSFGPYDILPGSANGSTGTVTTLTAGSLAPLFTTAVANPTTAPAVTFTPSAFAAHSFYGNGADSTGTPAAAPLGVSDWAPNAYVVGTGSAQAQAATLTPAATSLTAGLEVRWLPVAANTDAGPTLNVNGLGARSITKLGMTALVANDLTTSAVADAIYDGTHWQLQNPQTAASSGAAATVNPVAQVAWPRTSGSVLPTNLCPTSVTGNLTTGSAVVPLSGITDVYPGQLVTGTGIPTGTTVLVVNPSPLAVTLSAAATATATGVSLSFASIGQPFQNTANNTEYFCTSTGWQPQTSAVSSFATRVGAIVPSTGDYSAAQVTNAASTIAPNTFVQSQSLLNPTPATSSQTFQQSPTLSWTGSYLDSTGTSQYSTWGCYVDLSLPSESDLKCGQTGQPNAYFNVQNLKAGTVNASGFFSYANGDYLNNVVSLASGSAATSTQNLDSEHLRFGGSFFNSSSVNQTSNWEMWDAVGTGTTPADTLTVQPMTGGTPGTRSMWVQAPLRASGLTLDNLTVQNDCMLVGPNGTVIEGPCVNGGTNASSIQGTGVSATAPTTGQVLEYNGTTALWQAPSVASGTVALTPAAGVSQTIAQPSSTTFAVNNINNTYQASQYQNPAGTGNNGIAQAVALNSGTGIRVVADPGYAKTETIAGTDGGPYGGEMYNAIPGWPTLSHVADRRGGHDLDAYTEGGSATYNPTWQNAKYYFNTYDVTGNTLTFEGFLHQCDFTGQGQQINGFGGVNLKSYWFCDGLNTVATSQGQHLMHVANLQSNGVGDAINRTYNTACAGGEDAYTDQDCQDKNAAVGEKRTMTTGTITSVTSTSIQATIATGAGDQGDGRAVGDTNPAKVISGSYPTAYTLGDYAFPPSPTVWGINGPVPPMATFVGTSFTPSTLIMGCTTAFGGTCPNSTTANPTGQLNSASGGYAPGTLTVNVVTAAPGLPNAYGTSTTGFSAGDTVCVADQEYMEQTTVSAVPSATTITINFNKPHFNGFTISKGGYCGYGIENTGATTTLGGVKYQQVWPVVGTLDATHLLVWDHNSQQNWSRSLSGANTAGVCQTDNMTNISASGSVVTFTDGTSTAEPLFQNASNVVISTANSTYNGTFTLIATSGTYSGTANTPALQYTLSAAPSGTLPTTGTMTLCNSGFNLYPIFETQDVRNPSSNAVDGYFLATPHSNLSSFAVNDTITQFHWPAQRISEGGNVITQETPPPPYTGFTLGTVEQIGDNFTGYAARTEDNITAVTKYRGYGGTLPVSGMPAYNAVGMFSSLLQSVTAPDQAIIDIENCKAGPIGCNNAALSPIEVYSGPYASGKIWDNGPGGSVDVNGAFRINHGAFSMGLYSPQSGVMAVTSDQGNAMTTDGALWASALRLPGTVSGCAQFGSDGTLTSSGVKCGSGGGGTPGGATTNLQYNNAGVFGGDPSTTDDGAGNLGMTSIALNGTGGFQLTATEGSSIAGQAGKTVLWDDSTAHRFVMNPNNTGAVDLVGIAAAGTAGHCTTLAANGVDIVDGGGACVQGQVFNAQPSDTIASIEAECTSLCTYVASIPQTFTLTANHTLSSNVQVEFKGAGVWTVNGATYTLTIPGHVNGPTVRHFAGTGAIALGTTNTLVPVEWFGAVGDGTTDDTTALQAALNAVNQGQIQLACRTYVISVGLTITRGAVGVQGCGTNRAGSTITTASATINMLSVTGTSTAFSSSGVFRNFNLTRTVLPTGTASGFYASFAGALTVDTVDVHDSIRDFYIHAAPSYGTGRWTNDNADWFLTTYASGTNIFGYYLDSADGNAENSIRIRNSSAANDTGTSAATFVGMELYGSAVNDVMTYGFETANMTYGQTVYYTGAGNTLATSDIHFTKSTHDNCHISCYVISNTSAATDGSVEITGGWVNSSSSTGPLIDIESSYGVAVTNVLITQHDGFGASHAIYTYTSSNLTIANNTINNFGTTNAGYTPVEFNATTHSAFTGNTVVGHTGNAASMVYLTGNSTYNVLTGNALSGYAAGEGFYFDAGSNNNNCCAANSVDTTNITGGTVGGAGTGNRLNLSRPVGANFDGAGSALTAGKTIYYTVPFSCTIQAWNMTVDAGTATVDVWKVASGTAIPTSTNTITATATPAISTGTALHSTTLTGWTTAIATNDIVAFNLKAVATATAVSLVLQCQ